MVCLQVKRVSHLLTLPTLKLIKGSRKESGESDQDWIKLRLWLMPILNFQDLAHTDQRTPTRPRLRLLVRFSRYFFPIVFFLLLISLGLKGVHLDKRPSAEVTHMIL